MWLTEAFESLGNRKEVIGMNMRRKLVAELAAWGYARRLLEELAIEVLEGLLRSLRRGR